MNQKIVKHQQWLGCDLPQTGLAETSEPERDVACDMAVP